MLSDYVRASDLLRSIKKGDIVEFNRLTYLHYALYIGDEICVHVQQDGSDSGALLASSSGNRGVKDSYKIAERLVSIAGRFGVRVNNCETLASIHEVERRPILEILQTAKAGFPSDLHSPTGQIQIGVKVHVDYDIIKNNCEDYVTHWRYNHPTGWSIQARNGVIGTTFGTAERLADCVLYSVKIIKEETNNSVVRGAATAVGVAYVPVKYAAKALVFGTNVIAGNIHKNSIRKRNAQRN